MQLISSVGLRCLSCPISVITILLYNVGKFNLIKGKNAFKNIKYVTNVPKFLKEGDFDDQRVIMYRDKEDIIRTELNLHDHSDLTWHRNYNTKKNKTNYRPGTYRYDQITMHLCEHGAEGEPDQIDW